MKSFFRSFPYGTFAVSILCIILGLSMLLFPAIAEKVLCYGFGGVLILAGLLQTVTHLGQDKKGFVNTLLLLSGFMSAVVGVWLMFSPDKVKALAMIVMGIVLLYHGGMDIKYAFDLKSWNARSFGAVLLLGVATCGVGILMLVNPFKEQPNVLFICAGAGFLFDGLTDFFTSFAVGTAKAKYERLSGSAPVIELEPSSVQTLPLEETSEALPTQTSVAEIPAAEIPSADIPAADIPAVEPIAVTLEDIENN